MKKTIGILVLFVGESAAIYSEMIAAKNLENFFNTFWKMFGLMIISALFLILGYMLCMKYIQNIWVVSAISIASIVIIEPTITYFVFHSLPSRGALIGLVLGLLAIASALFIK